MFKQAGPLMKKVKTPTILIKYGKAKESEGAFKEAEEAYEDAEAWEDVVRINLNNFDNLEKPKDILRNKCSTSTVASIVASYCEKRGFWKEAVEFSIMANRKEEAFVMAQTHSEMDTYADCLKECTSEERTQIAQYYEGKSIWDKAAKQY
jgi:WD repeat-containing protein 19